MYIILWYSKATIMMMSSEESLESRRLFVGGLDYNTEEVSVATYFSNWGPLAECSIKKFPDGRSRGFGFVTFSSRAAAEFCYSSNQHFIEGKKIDLRWSAQGDSPNVKYDPEAPALRKLFIGGLVDSITQGDLANYFSMYGEIEKVNQKGLHWTSTWSQ